MFVKQDAYKAARWVLPSQIADLAVQWKWVEPPKPLSSGQQFWQSVTDLIKYIGFVCTVTYRRTKDPTKTTYAGCTVFITYIFLYVKSLFAGDQVSELKKYVELSRASDKDIVLTDTNLQDCLTDDVVDMEFIHQPVVMSCCGETFDQRALMLHEDSLQRAKQPKTCPVCRCEFKELEAAIITEIYNRIVDSAKRIQVEEEVDVPNSEDKKFQVVTKYQSDLTILDFKDLLTNPNTNKLYDRPIIYAAAATTDNEGPKVVVEDYARCMKLPGNETTVATKKHGELSASDLADWTEFPIELKATEDKVVLPDSEPIETKTGTLDLKTLQSWTESDWQTNCPIQTTSGGLLTKADLVKKVPKKISEHDLRPGAQHKLLMKLVELYKARSRN